MTVYYVGDHDTLINAPHVIASDLRRELAEFSGRKAAPEQPVRKAAPGLMSLQGTEPAAG
jgi:hypothetical protein